MSKKQLEGKIALITGASRGIGAAVARAFAAEGAHVILVGRTISGLEETDDAIKAIGGEATIVPLDLMQYEKIDELGSIISERFGRLDILVGNAGMLGVLSPVGHITPEVWEKTFSLNVTANYRLIRSFDSLLKRSKAGRAMFVTSNVTQGEMPFWGVYSASKAALEKLVMTYASEVDSSNIRVNLVDPGVVQSKMRAEAMPGEDASILTKPDDVTDFFVKLALDSCKENGKIFRK